MEDETSNDLIPVETTSEADVLRDKPIMLLFTRLIGNESKQNTVLTNAQIMGILEKEFDINTNQVHELEMDIYLSVMKKFLKDWPQWDEFDAAINDLKQQNDQAEIQKMLVTKYHQLKSYLSNMLDVARPRAQEKVKEVTERFDKEEPKKREIESPEQDLSDVILEIHCTRAQLNNLFYSHPHPEQNYTIFNASTQGPSTICLDTPDYDALLNWWNVNITFKTNSLHIVRLTTHDIQHTLINKALVKKNKVFKLKKGYQETPLGAIRPIEARSFKKHALANTLKKIYDNCAEQDFKPILRVLLAALEKDLNSLPNELLDQFAYRKYFCKYPYVRYLYTDVPEAENYKDSMKYDLKLREVISPMFQLNISKIEPMFGLVQYNLVDLKGIQVSCSSCNIKYGGVTMLEQLKQHILENHLNEPDLHCIKCRETFSMVHLTKNRWIHECYIKKY